MFSERFTALSYAIRTSPVYVAVFLMRFSFAFTVVALQYIVPIPYQRGVVASAYPIMEMFTGLLFGILADKIGRKWIIVGALLFSSFVTYSFTLTNSFILLVLIHGLQGICAAAIITSTLASLADIAKPESRGREMGLYDFCTVGGYGLGFVFSLLLIGGQVSRALMPFYVGAAIALIGGVVSALLLKDQKVVTGPSFSILANIRQILANRKSLTLAATWFVVTTLIGVGLTYTRELFSTILSGKTLGLLAGSSPSGQPTKIGLLVAVLLIFGILLLGFSQTSLGGLSDKFGRARLVLIGQVSILGLLVILVLLFEFNLNRYVAIPFIVLFGTGLLAFTPAGLAELADIAPASARGSTMGLYSITVGAGTVFAPLAGGALISIYGRATGFSIIFSVGILIMVVVLAARLRRT
ncbi:MAG: MFS transporter [Thaumarchaeota archaeon]|nr:MFS transporter [Nitrososphaerota archaeon]